MSTLLTLMWEFFKTGLFAVGGGLATVPFLKEMGIKYGWFDMSQLASMIAVSESTPGPIGINMATYVGYEVAGPLGSILATLSLVFPSVVVICIIANFLKKFSDSKLVKDIFSGLKPAVTAFIGAACIDLFRTVFLNGGWQPQWNVIVLALCLGLVYWKKPKWHPIVIIGIGAVVGIVLNF
jgi:chromate transporter